MPHLNDRPVWTPDERRQARDQRLRLEERAREEETWQWLGLGEPPRSDDETRAFIGTFPVDGTSQVITTWSAARKNDLHALFQGSRLIRWPLIYIVPDLSQLDFIRGFPPERMHLDPLYFDHVSPETADAVLAIMTRGIDTGLTGEFVRYSVAISDFRRLF